MNLVSAAGSKAPTITAHIGWERNLYPSSRNLPPSYVFTIGTIIMGLKWLRAGSAKALVVTQIESKSSLVNLGLKTK